MQTRVHPPAPSARLYAGGLFVLSAIVLGCAQLDPGRVWPWSTAKAEKPQPARMTVVWTHATESETGREMRGFRGRIFFYPTKKALPGKPAESKLAEKDRDQPMKVEGTLTVYVFEQAADGKLSPATPRKYLFTPEKLKKQCAESKQGPSYQVWLPWDTVGGPPKHVNLWTRFDGIAPKVIVVSDHSPQLLPGVSQMAAVAKAAGSVKPASPPSSASEKASGPIAQAGYTQPADSKGAGGAQTSSQTADSQPATADWWK